MREFSVIRGSRGVRTCTTCEKPLFACGHALSPREALRAIHARSVAEWRRIDEAKQADRRREVEYRV